MGDNAVAISGKYGKVDIPKIGTDEPVFILRAQDKLAEATIGIYRLLANTHHLKLTDSLQKEIDAFNKWSGMKKLPD
jgi:hypothetical protein